ncbi:MAG: hypothetical protein ACYCQJ_15900 [Nitrososphaerales archaeon]
MGHFLDSLYRSLARLSLNNRQLEAGDKFEAMVCDAYERLGFEIFTKDQIPNSFWKEFGLRKGEAIEGLLKDPDGYYHPYQCKYTTKPRLPYISGKFLEYVGLFEKSRLGKPILITNAKYTSPDKRFKIVSGDLTEELLSSYYDSLDASQGPLSNQFKAFCKLLVKKVKLDPFYARQVLQDNAELLIDIFQYQNTTTLKTTVTCHMDAALDDTRAWHKLDRTWCNHSKNDVFRSSLKTDQTQYIELKLTRDDIRNINELKKVHLDGKIRYNFLNHRNLDWKKFC